MTDIVLGGAPPRSRLLPRFLVFGLVVVVIVGVLTTRLFELQIARGAHYAGLAQSNRITLQAIRSPRGPITDRTGRPLVRNVPAFVVKVRPADLPYSQRPRVTARLSELLRIPREEMVAALDRNAGSRFDLVRIANDVPPDVARIIAEDHLSLPGVEVTVEARRDYRYGPLVSHVVGFTGAISGEEYETLRDEGYIADDVIGKAGVEATYERELRGTYGVEEVERDASGRTLSVLRTLREAQPGNSLELTLDVGMQRDAEKALRWAMDLAGLKRGVVLVMNPQTGEVLAMVSLPAYDNNLFARGISAADYRKLLTDPDRPLLNHAISEQYPPGSTYKLVTGTGGLADGHITPQTELMTKSYLEIGRYKYWEWNKRGWGPLNIYDGFGHSSDTFFFQVAGMLGIDRLAYWARQFGFGERTGIELPGEAKGILPTHQWKQELFGQRVFSGETYQAGIGQGYNAFTPLQLLNAYCALANGGNLLQPQVVRRVLDPSGRVVRDFQPKLIHRLDVDPDVLRTMRIASRRVLTIRHTSNLVDLPLVVAGKSGTAQFGIRDKQGRLPYHSWFAAFLPRDPRRNPADPDGYRAVARPDSELAVLAFAYDSRTKGNAAVEIVKYFLQLHYKLDVDLRNHDLVKRGNFYQSN